jgi:hypothetical protein
VWKEAIVAYFKALFVHSLGRISKNQEKCQYGNSHGGSDTITAMLAPSVAATTH